MSTWCQGILAKKYINRARIYYRDKKKGEVVLNFLNDVDGATVLFCGFRKSGNTWSRFIIFNYFNILINGAEETLTYDELNSIQYHALDGGVAGPFQKGFPYFYRTHWSYSGHKRIFEKFSKVIYIYRHPLDVLTSLYHVNAKRTDMKVPSDIDYMAYQNTLKWIKHYKSTAHQSDLILNYERMRQNTKQEILKAFMLMEVDIDESILHTRIPRQLIKKPTKHTHSA